MFVSSKIAEKHLKLPGYSSLTEYLSKPSFNNSIPKTKIPQNSEIKNKPRGLYFSKALYEGLIFGGAYLEGDLRFKIDWASLIVGSKFTIFALFYFVFEKLHLFFVQLADREHDVFLLSSVSEPHTASRN